jgi:hypothetical protein
LLTKFQVYNEKIHHQDRKLRADSYS